MAYGIEIWNRMGQKAFDVTDIAARIAYEGLATAGTSGSKVLSEIANKKTFQFASVITPAGYFPHLVTRSGTTISWAPWSAGTYSPNGNSMIFVLIYD